MRGLAKCFELERSKHAQTLLLTREGGGMGRENADGYDGYRYAESVHKGLLSNEIASARRGSNVYRFGCLASP